MILFELDDFNYWVDNSVTGGRGTEVFAPMFVFLVDWAVKRGQSEEAFISDPILSKLYSDLITEKISFVEFVFDGLDGKLLDTNFAEDIRDFVRDYVEYDGYSNDLVGSLKVNLWELPNNFKYTKSLYDAIDRSLKNYKRNKVINPEIISFSDERK